MVFTAGVGRDGEDTLVHSPLVKLATWLQPQRLGRWGNAEGCIDVWQVSTSKSSISRQCPINTSEAWMWFISVWRPKNEKNKFFALACSSVSMADRIITAVTLIGIPNNVLLFGKAKNGVTSHHWSPVLWNPPDVGRHPILLGGSSVIRFSGVPLSTLLQWALAWGIPPSFFTFFGHDWSRHGVNVPSSRAAHLLSLLSVYGRADLRASLGLRGFVLQHLVSRGNQCISLKN